MKFSQVFVIFSLLFAISFAAPANWNANDEGKASHYRHETEQDSYSREKSDDEYDDSYEPQSVARQRIAGGEIVNNHKKFEIVLDVRNYKPDEIEVKVNRDDLIVTGKQQTEEKGRNITRQFTRNFKLPRDVSVRSVQSRVSVDGYLDVYARKKTSWDEDRVINILMTGPIGAIRRT